MSPITGGPTFASEVENGSSSKDIPVSSGRCMLQLTQATLNLTAFILIGIVVGICVLFSFRLGTPLNNLNIHIILCVLGYQLLMGVGILILTSESGFSASLSLRHKRLLHTLVQVIGSALAIAGSIIMSLSKTVNWNTLHGQTALVAMVFTTVSLVNGLASLYAYELRKCIPSNLSKLTHILFGIVAFVMATVSLCYGFDKTGFKNWATPDFTIAIIVKTAIFTAICIINPFITFFSKIKNMVQN